jgi:hypothetical protein
MAGSGTLTSRMRRLGIVLVMAAIVTALAASRSPQPVAPTPLAPSPRSAAAADQLPVGDQEHVD